MEDILELPLILPQHLFKIQEWSKLRLIPDTGDDGLKLSPGDGLDKAHDPLNIAKVALPVKIKLLLPPSGF
jgi:hypothetical protein